ncbi:hydrogenase maturation nickel metallochaperone HypA [Candidatus Contubernalis alkaliaceticus]|uniref:hydrogenase maturation nickel metallochaperone HypA n=1 Tax=Candidatus Contubernalis alkaliaceticus TaxID=338645 RepID=UPI001F4C1EA0|nr:hydrogenase maturation nickel metallochaperone HypA [Candidatus Contubernalis alkalaceticus]UNC92290.1 hydrogenase maturation nickel metallochaperone HypA [Candidatus Contubernalis alkalaceticus]
MHELALVKGMLEAVLEQAETHKIKKIEKIKIVVGKMTSAMPEALQFAFEVLSRDTPAQGAVLEIEIRPIKLSCQDCHLLFRPKGLKYSCPECAGSRTEIVQGRELSVEYIEGE